MAAHRKMVGFIFCSGVSQEPLIGGESSLWWAVSEGTMQLPSSTGRASVCRPDHHPPKCEESEVKYVELHVMSVEELSLVFIKLLSREVQTLGCPGILSA